MTARHSSEPGSPPAAARAYVGPGLILVCAVHIAVGVADAASVLRDAAHDGWAGAFTGDRAVALWFLMTGVVGIVAGLAIAVIERSGRMPWSVSIALLLSVLVIGEEVNASGFVLVLAVAVLAVARSAYTSRSGSARAEV